MDWERTNLRQAAIEIHVRTTVKANAPAEPALLPPRYESAPVTIPAHMTESANRLRSSW